MAKWTLINSENVKAFECDDGYSSKMLTCDEVAGIPIININEGLLKAGHRTQGGAHEETEIYYIIEGDGDVWLDDDCISVKRGDTIIIPPHVFHWIDNTKSSKPFILHTYWPKQEQNAVFFARMEAWGTSVKLIDKDYVKKRLK